MCLIVLSYRHAIFVELLVYSPRLKRFVVARGMAYRS